MDIRELVRKGRVLGETLDDLGQNGRRSLVVTAALCRLNERTACDNRVFFLARIDLNIKEGFEPEERVGGDIQEPVEIIESQLSLVLVEEVGRELFVLIRELLVELALALENGDELET